MKNRNFVIVNKSKIILALLAVMLVAIVSFLGLSITSVKADTPAHQIIGASVRAPRENEDIGAAIRFAYVVDTTKVNLEDIEEMGVLVNLESNGTPTVSNTPNGKVGENVVYIKNSEMTQNKYNVCSLNENGEYIIDSEGNYVVMYVYCYNIPINNLHTNLVSVGYYKLSGVDDYEYSNMAKNSVAGVIKSALDEFGTDSDFAETIESLEGVLERATDHKGGTSTYTDKATCTICGYEYGSLIPIEYSLKDGFTSEVLTNVFGDEVTVESATCSDEAITVGISGGKLTVEGDYTFDNPIEFTLTAGAITKTVNLKLYTDIITTAEEVGELIILDGGGTSGSFKNNNGYYILGNDINLNYQDFNQDPWSIRNASFTGTLDGRGHTISNYLVQKYGLFGYISDNAVIKNVAITNAKFGCSQGNPLGSGVLAFGIKSTSKATAPIISNVYIQLIDVNSQAYTSAIAYERVHANDRVGGYEKIENCIFEVSDASATASIYSSDSSRNSPERWQVSNTYVISPVRLIPDTGYDAENKNPTSVLGGFIRYDSYTEMSGITNNDYSSFDSNYWNTDAFGVPVWDNLPESVKTPSISLNGGLEEISLGTVEFNDLSTSITLNANTTLFGKEFMAEYSLKNNDGVVELSGNVLSALSSGSAILVVTLTDTDLIKEIPVTVYEASIDTGLTLDYSMKDGFTNDMLTTIFGKVVNIDGVICAKDAISVSISGNKLVFSGSAVYDTAIEFSLYVGGVGYTVKLKLYTDIITTAEELDALIIEADNTGWGKIANNAGYYILGDDINLNYTDLAQDPSWDANSKGFTGFLDGRGHTIDKYLVQKFGLFGKISNNAVIKNLALTNVKFGVKGSTGVLAREISSSSKTIYPTISNVYVQVVDLNGQWGTAGLAYQRTGGYEKIENCIIEVLCTNTTDYSGSLFMYDSSRLTSAENCQVSNTYVISTLRVTTDTGFDASNKNPTNIIAGFIRYDSYEEMSGVVSNDYSSFDAAYWDITTKGYPIWNN